MLSHRVLTGSSRIDNGVRQGDGLAPIVFNLVLEAVMRRVKVRRNATLIHHSYQILGYADDLDIAGRIMKAIREIFEAIEGETKSVGLEINEEKTKFMLVSRSQNAKKSIGKRMNIGQYSFEVVNEFSYLSIISSDNNESIEIKKRPSQSQWSVFQPHSLAESKRTVKNDQSNNLQNPHKTYNNIRIGVLGAETHGCHETGCL